MLYHLFEYLDQEFGLFGAGVFKYITFRSASAALLSLLFSMIIGKRLIHYLQKKQIGEVVRDLGLEGQIEKKGTPTMGGIIIISSILIPVLLFGNLTNVYIQMLLIATVWLGLIGFIDDYIKVFKKNKEGLAGKFKIVGQIGLGIIIGTMLFFHEDVVVRDFDVSNESQAIMEQGYKDVKSTRVTVPFMKDNEWDYQNLFPFMGEYTWIVYILVVTFIITAVSNGANMTDGLDGLAAGSSAIIGFVLAIFAWVSGNAIFSDYLNIMFIPNIGEMVIFCTAFVGACIGFLWYNSYPAQVFMGDTGSLSIGGIIAVLAIAVRKELLLPLICGIFLIENLSVLIQIGYFKYTKRKYGEGRRIYRMAPLHHHYQKLGYHESKIVTRFWIAGLLLAIISLVTLKLR